MAKKRNIKITQTSGVDYPDFTYKNKACLRFNDGNVIQLALDADKKQISVIWEDLINDEVYSGTFDLSKLILEEAE